MLTFKAQANTDFYVEDWAMVTKGRFKNCALHIYDIYKFRNDPVIYRGGLSCAHLHFTLPHGGEVIREFTSDFLREPKEQEIVE